MPADVDGPILTGQWESRLNSAREEIQEIIADGMIGLMKGHFHSDFKHPTGRYERNIHTLVKDEDLIITDAGLVYGDWLEGTSARNQSTRFKGYWIFRRVSQAAGGRGVSRGRYLVERALS